MAEPLLLYVSNLQQMPRPLEFVLLRDRSYLRLIVVSQNGSTVRQAILDVDEDSGTSLSVTNTGSVPTNIAEHPLRVDNVHYNWIGILALGRSMAYEMLKLYCRS